MDKGRLTGKVAVVTGSTSGIGEATVRLFTREGARVVVVGRRADKGTKIVAEIVEAGGEAIFCQTDMTDDNQVRAMVNEALSRYGQIDILVNNAGKIIEKPFEELTDADWDSFVALDARAYFKCMQMVLPHMVKRGCGSIVNVTSLAAIKPHPMHALYNFVKAGVTHMTKSVAMEYAPKNIRVNALLSGAVLTEMIDPDAPHFDEMTNFIPMRRASTAEEQAYAILFLASDEASYITGASLVADGGIIN